jgi:hypothetical protein
MTGGPTTGIAARENAAARENDRPLLGTDPLGAGELLACAVVAALPALAARSVVR